MLSEAVYTDMTISFREFRRRPQDVEHALRRGVPVWLTCYRRVWGVIVPPDMAPAEDEGGRTRQWGPGPLFGYRDWRRRADWTIPSRRDSLIRCIEPTADFILMSDAIARYEDGCEAARAVFEGADSLWLSPVTYMEAIRGRLSRYHQICFATFRSRLGVRFVPLDPEVAQRAQTIMEIYGVLDVGTISLHPEEAFAAAAALLRNLTVLSTDVGRLAQIPGLKLAELSEAGATSVKPREPPVPVSAWTPGQELS